MHFSLDLPCETPEDTNARFISTIKLNSQRLNSHGAKPRKFYPSISFNFLLLQDSKDLHSLLRPIGIWACKDLYGQYSASIMSKNLTWAACCPAASAVHHTGLVWCFTFMLCTLSLAEPAGNTHGVARSPRKGFVISWDCSCEYGDLFDGEDCNVMGVRYGKHCCNWPRDLFRNRKSSYWNTLGRERSKFSSAHRVSSYTISHSTHFSLFISGWCNVLPCNPPAEVPPQRQRRERSRESADKVGWNSAAGGSGTQQLQQPGLHHSHRPARHNHRGERRTSSALPDLFLQASV